METNFKTMLAIKGTEERLETLLDVEGSFFASPKLDGVRCIVHPELGPVTRTLKPIPNKHIRKVLSDPRFDGLDGEIVSGLNFSETQSAVMSFEGKPNFKFYAFDWFTDRYWRKGETTMESFSERYIKLEAACAIAKSSKCLVLRLVPHANITTMEQFREFHNLNLEQGFEGTMVRSAMGPYKHGRSTLKQGYLLKFKPVSDCEVLVTGFEKLVDKNGNERNEIGVLKGIILNGPFKDSHVEVGTGFTKAQRETYYGRIYHLIDNEKVFTMEYQLEGAKDKPRFPSFKGFRAREDFDNA